MVLIKLTYRTTEKLTCPPKRSLSDAGPDDPRWVIALCPNCRRRAHYGEDRDSFSNRLIDVVSNKERQ